MSVFFAATFFCLFTFNLIILPNWQGSWLNFLYIVSLITILFSMQFNQSRFALLTIVLLLFHLSNSNMANVDLLNDVLPFWQLNGNWQFLSGVFILTFLAFAKERSLFSIHAIYRFFILALLVCFAYVWLIFYQWLVLNYQNLFTSFPLINWLEINIVIVLSAILLTYKSLTTRALFQPAILVTLIIWCLYFFDLWTFSWTITLIGFTIYYLLSVVVSSYFLAYRDELTALPSRRALFQLALSLGRNYSVAMIDIDHFKKFNDTYGHDIGDQVLKLVATKLTNVKLGGRVFRYGGEEFTVVFPRKKAEQVFDELDRVRQLIADYTMVIRQPQRKGKTARNSEKSTQKSVSVTISIGLAQRLKKQNFEQVMKTADEKLYQAKNKGRNNVSY